MVQQQVQTIATDYQAMTEEQQATFAASEEGAAQLAAVNEALAGLGLEQIESLDQLNTALETLGSIDLTAFSLAEVQAAFTSVGGDASEAQAKVDALKDSLDALDGVSTTSKHTHTNWIVNRTISIAGGRVALNAEGGIYDGAMLSWVAEDGPEAIIPLGAKRRERGLELWLQAGEMLGVAEFSDGGIVHPTAAFLEASRMIHGTITAISHRPLSAQGTETAAQAERESPSVFPPTLCSTSKAAAIRTISSRRSRQSSRRLRKSSAARLQISLKIFS